MDIQILREFADLAYTLNFNKTAERMFIGQSTLSKHIMSLETELGIQLFVRTKHGVHLTQTGKAFLPKVSHILSEYDTALTMIHKSKTNLSGQIRIGFLDMAVRDILIQSINSYRKQFPNMQITLQSFQIGDMLNAFKNNAIDIALSIFYSNSFLPPDTVFQLLYEDSVSAVIPHNHPLNAKDKLYFNDLLQYPLILPSPKQYASYAKIIEEYIENAPTPANIICDFTHIDTALIMVEAEMGISILPTNIGGHPTTATFRKIEDCHPVLQIGAMWKKTNLSIGIPEYIDVLFNEVNK